MSKGRGCSKVGHQLNHRSIQSDLRPLVLTPAICQDDGDSMRQRLPLGD